MEIAQFRRIIWRHYRMHRRDLPWRNTRDPYRILVSEIMLQQTQVSRVFLYYQKFLRAFPNFRALSRAPLASVLRVWQGLGYNRRALYLQKLAKTVVEHHGGKLSGSPTLLEKLPGIGKATAGAIASFAFNIPAPFIETNIRRVFIYFFFPRKKKVSDKEILPLVAKTLDRKNLREWYYALMDYGAALGRERENPNRRSKMYHRQPPFRGSRRELRGRIVALLARNGSIKKKEILKQFPNHVLQINEVFKKLEQDGLIKNSRGVISLVS